MKFTCFMDSFSYGNTTTKTKRSNYYQSIDLSSVKKQKKKISFLFLFVRKNYFLSTSIVCDAHAIQRPTEKCIFFLFVYKQLTRCWSFPPYFSERKSNRGEKFSNEKTGNAWKNSPAHLLRCETGKWFWFVGGANSIDSAAVHTALLNAFLFYFYSAIAVIIDHNRIYFIC